MPTKQQVILYMYGCWREHVDNTCNVLNCTSLAEDAADHFDLYLNQVDYGIDQDIYDDAIEVELELIKKGLVNE